MVIRRLIMLSQIRVGELVKDTSKHGTGIEGRVEARIEHEHGWEQVSIRPPGLDKDGQLKKGVTIDVEDVEVIDHEGGKPIPIPKVTVGSTGTIAQFNKGRNKITGRVKTRVECKNGCVRLEIQPDKLLDSGAPPDLLVVMEQDFIPDKLAPLRTAEQPRSGGPMMEFD